jgi:HEAT repeat protein
MRNPFQIIFALLALAIIAALGAEALRTREPSNKGKTLDEWLDDYNAAGNMTKTAPASEAIRAMGTNCLPLLLEHIRHQGSKLEYKLFNILVNQHWIKHQFYGPDPYRGASVLALNALGSNAAAILPALSDMAQSPDGPTSWYGSMSLLAVGPTAIPTLTKICQSTNQLVRDQAVTMIATLKAMPTPWISWTWNAPFPTLNARPGFYVSFSGSNETYRELIRLLGKGDSAIRRASAEAMLDYLQTPLANEAIAPLVKALNDPDPAVRLAAAEAIKKIAPETAAKEGEK